MRRLRLVGIWVAIPVSDRVRDGVLLRLTRTRALSKPPTSAPGGLRALRPGPRGGARARRGLPYFHNSSGTAAALNPAKSFAAIGITTTISIHNKYRKSANDYLSQNSGRNLTAK